MTSSGRYTYAREILCKNAAKIEQLHSNIDCAAFGTRNNLLNFDAPLKSLLLYGDEI